MVFMLLPQGRAVIASKNASGPVAKRNPTERYTPINYTCQTPNPSLHLRPGSPYSQRVNQPFRSAISIEQPMSDEKKRPDLRIIDGSAGSEPVEPPKPKRKRRLTAKQEKFLDGMIKGMTQADALRDSRDCTNWKPSAIYTEANRLMGHPEIHRRLVAHRASVERSAVSSAVSKRLWIIERLEALADHADTGSTKVRALELLGKCSGVDLFQDRLSVETDDQSSGDLRAELERKLQSLLTS